MSMEILDFVFKMKKNKVLKKRVELDILTEKIVKQGHTSILKLFNPSIFKN